MAAAPPGRRAGTARGRPRTARPRPGAGRRPSATSSKTSSEQVATIRSASPGQRRLRPQPGRRAGVLAALVPPLDHAERVEGLHHRDPERPGRGQGGQPGHPEVGVDHVRRVVPARPPQPVGELVHVRQQVVLGDRLGRAGVDVLDRHPGRRRDPRRQVRVVAPGVDDHLVPRAWPARPRARPRARSARRRRPRRARPAGWRARDTIAILMRATSSSRPSQSPRNRSSP